MEQSFTLKRLGQWLKRSLPLALAAALVGGILGLAYALIAPASYSSSSSVILGTYTIPSSLAMEGGISTAGPLGLELPSETMVSLVGSQLVSDYAVKSDSSLGTSKDLADATTVTAPTSNSVDITCTGSSAALAQKRADAMARALIAYRKATVDAQLTSTANGMQSAIDARNTRIAQIQTALAKATGATEQGLLNEEDELSKSNASDQSTLSSLKAEIKAFDGGAVVSSSASSAVRSPSILVMFAVGLLAGLLLALLGRLIWGVLTGRLSAGDGMAKFGRPVLLGEGDWSGEGDVPAPLVRSVISHQTGDGRPISVVSLGDASTSSKAVTALSALPGSQGPASYRDAGSVQASGPIPLGASDAVIVAADQHRASAVEVRQAIEAIEATGAHVIGVALPDTPQVDRWGVRNRLGGAHPARGAGRHR